MSEFESPTFKVAWARVVARAAVDPEFKKACETDPLPLFKEQGYETDDHQALSEYVKTNLQPALDALDNKTSQPDSAQAKPQAEQQAQYAAGAYPCGNCQCATQLCYCNCAATIPRQQVMASTQLRGAAAGGGSVTTDGCSGCIGTAGSLGSWCGTAGSAGTAGSYGCGVVRDDLMAAAAVSCVGCDATRGHCVSTIGSAATIVSPSVAQAVRSTRLGYSGITAPPIQTDGCWGSAGTVGSAGSFCGCAGSVGTAGSYGSHVRDTVAQRAAAPIASTQLGTVQMDGCWGSAGTFGSAGSFCGCAGSAGTAGTYGSHVAESMARSGSLASMRPLVTSTRLGASIASHAVPVLQPDGCSGTIGTAGSIGSWCGTAGSAATAGSYGCGVHADYVY